MGIAGAVLILATPAVADGCRLNTNQCAIIAREMAAEQVNIFQDQQSFGLNLPSYERQRVIIKRH